VGRFVSYFVCHTFSLDWGCLQMVQRRYNGDWSVEMTMMLHMLSSSERGLWEDQ
jgi:hypothetical protein